MEEESSDVVWIIIRNIFHGNDCCAPLGVKKLPAWSSSDIVRIQRFSSLQITLSLFEHVRITRQRVGQKSEYVDIVNSKSSVILDRMLCEFDGLGVIKRVEFHLID